MVALVVFLIAFVTLIGFVYGIFNTDVVLGFLPNNFISYSELNSFLVIGSIFLFIFVIMGIPMLLSNKQLKRAPLLTESVIAISSIPLVFEFPDKQRHIIETTVRDIPFFVEGDRGVLSYKKDKNGLIFVDFQLQSSGRKEEWKCAYCRTLNEAETIVCRSCNASKKKV